jgi:hypothetical protein
MRRKTLIWASMVAILIGAVAWIVNQTEEVAQLIGTFLVLFWWLIAAWLVWSAMTWRRHPRRVYIVAALLVGVFVLAEFGLRFLHPLGAARGILAACRFSPELHHAVAPSHTFTTEHYSGNGFARYTFNADGLRTSYTAETFAGHRNRIAVLGDSFAFGLGVNEEETFIFRLEHSLRDDFDVAVLNSGLVSYSPLIEKRQLDLLIRKYQPTIVLQLFDPSDIGDDIAYGRTLHSENGRERFSLDGVCRTGPALSDHLALVQRVPLTDLLFFRPGTLLRHLKESNRPLFEGDPHWSFIFKHPLERTRPFFEKSWSYVRATADAAEDMGAHYAFIVSPRYQHWDTEECPDDPLANLYKNQPYEDSYFEFFAAVEANATFPIWSLREAFASSTVRPLVFRHDSHWNHQGHALVAETLGDLLRKIEWLRASD